MLDGRRRLNLRGTALADLPDDLSVGGQVKFREVSGVEPGEAEQPARATVQGRFCGQQRHCLKVGGARPEGGIFRPVFSLR